MEFTAENIAQDYLSLADPNSAISQQANKHLMAFRESKEAWVVAREFLNVPSKILQFLGAQVLYIKIKSDFAVLSAQDQNEIREFIFGALNNSLNKYNIQTFRQLCASATVIAFRTMPFNWENFVSDMMQLANSSNDNLLAVLEIFSNFHRESTQIQIQDKFRLRVIDILKADNNQLFQFFSVVLEKFDDQRIIIKALDCIASLAELRAFELLNYPSLIDLLIKQLSTDQTFSFAIEALCDSVLYSNQADIINTCRFENAMAAISSEVKTSIQKLIGLLITEVYPKYLEQKDSNKTSFCQGMTKLAAHIGNHFNIFIFENTEYSKALLKFLLVCTSHQDRNISQLTFDFWVSFSQAVTNKDILPYLKNSDYLFISETYLELYKTVIQKCKLSSVKVISIKESVKTKIYNIETDQEEDYDETEIAADFQKQQTLSIKEYRSLVEEVFYGCYTVLEGILEEEGIKEIFALVIPLLSPDYVTNNNINLNDPNVKIDYILNCEAAIFSVKSMLIRPDPTKPYDYVSEVVKLIVDLPHEDVLTREVLNYLSDMASQIVFTPEFANKVFNYCFKGITNPHTSNAAAKCFYGLTKVLGENVSLEVLEKITSLMDNEIYLIEDVDINQEFVLGIFHIATTIPNYEIRLKYLQKIFASVEEKFQNFTQFLQKNESSVLTNLEIRKDALRLFKTIKTILKGFSKECIKDQNTSEEFLNATVLPFILKNMDYICAYFELFSSQVDFVEMFSHIIKTSVSISGMKLEESYTKILNLILQVFGANPLQNWNLLDTAGELIMNFKNAEIQKQWLLSNFSEFNSTILNYLTSKADPDLFGKWIHILQNSFELYPDYILSLPEIDKIMEFVLFAFSSSNEYDLQKKITYFLNALVKDKTTLYNATMLKFVPKIIGVIFVKMLDLQNTSIVSKVISGILIGFEQDKDQLVELLFNALSVDQFKEIEDKHKKIFLEAIFVYRNDTRGLTGLLGAFKEFALGGKLMMDSMVYIEERLVTFGRPKA